MPGTHMVLSFQFQKHLKIGRGGMILTDNKEAYEDYLKDLVQKFQDNIKKFDIREEIIKAGPGF